MIKTLAMSVCSTQRIWPALRLALFVTSWFGFSIVAEAFWHDDVGYTMLEETLGDQIPTGQGVFISQVEAEQRVDGEVVPGRYFPDPNSIQFNASLDPFGVEPTFVNGSEVKYPNPTTSTHATNSVAKHYYGDITGLALGANTIVIYEANDYLKTFLNCGNSGCGSMAPDAPTFTDPNDGQEKSYVVQNHAWAGTYDKDDPLNDDDQKVLRKVDYLVDQYELTTLVGVKNGTPIDPNDGTGNPHPTLDNLLGYSYNAIVVGRSTGLHAIGPTSDLYGPDRTRPSIVSPMTTPSAAVATVSGAATLMHEELAGTDGARSEPMRAILLAGATKEEFIDFVDPDGGDPNDPDGWTRTSSQPLDSILGAGELNVFNSYLITQGEFDGSPVESYGWDYNEVDNNTQRYYEIEIPDGSIALDFSVILTWNVDVNPSFNSETLANLSLTLTNVTDPNSPVDQSDSSVDNVEHIYIGEGQAVEYLAPGSYTLEISGDMAQDYGIAWRTSTLFGDDPNNLTPSADFDEDGDVDGVDFLTWQLGLGTLVGASHGDGDADGDGDVDDNDLAIFEADYGSSALVASIVGVPEPGAMVLAAIVVLMCLLSHRQKVMRRAI